MKIPLRLVALAATLLFLITSSAFGQMVVDTRNIRNDAVTLAKMANIATQRLVGRNTGGTGDPEAITIQQALNWISTTQGAILYHNGTNFVALSPGTNGQFLKTQGSSANPIWDTVVATDDQTAAEVAVTPSGNLAADDVQEALTELQTDIDGRESATSNDIDPDRLAGDTSDDNVLDVAAGGTGASTAEGARTALGLEIGTNVLAPNGDGSGLSGVAKTGASNSFAGTQTFVATARTVYATESGAAVGAAVTIDATNGDEQTVLLDENTTVTLDNWPSTGTSATVFVWFVQDETGTNTVALEGTPTYFDGDGNEITTLNVDATADAQTLVVFKSRDGGLTYIVGQPSNGTTPADGSVTTAKVAAETLVTESDSIASNDNDTTIPTSAAVKDYADTATSGKANLSGGNTFSGAQLLAEGASIALDAASSADGAFSGITRAGVAGATLAFGDLVVLDPTDSRWELADANSAAAADGDARGLIGICVLAAAADGDPTMILLHGIVRADTAFPTLTINGPLFVSETAGDVTQTSPTTEDAVIRVLGAAWTADEVYFAPSYSHTTYAETE